MMRIAYICDEFSIRHLKILLAMRSLRPKWSVVVIARNYRNLEYQPHYLHHTWHTHQHIETALRAYPADVAFVAPSFDMDLVRVVKSARNMPVVFQVFDWLVERASIMSGFKESGMGVVGSLADAAAVRAETGVDPLVIYPAMPAAMVATVMSSRQRQLSNWSLCYYGGINEHVPYRDYMPVFERLRNQGWNHPVYIYASDTPSRALRARYEEVGIPVFDPRGVMSALSLVSRHSHVWVGANSPECSYDSVVRNVLFDVLATGAVPVSCGLFEQETWMRENDIGEVVSWDDLNPDRMASKWPKRIDSIKSLFTAEHWVEPLIKSLEA